MRERARGDGTAPRETHAVEKLVSRGELAPWWRAERTVGSRGRGDGDGDVVARGQRIEQLVAEQVVGALLVLAGLVVTRLSPKTPVGQEAGPGR